MKGLDILMAGVSLSTGEEYIREVTISTESPAQILRIDHDKDSHRGPKVRGKGKKAYRGSL